MEHEQAIADNISRVYEHKYGLKTTVKLSPLELELICFSTDRKEGEGGLGKAGHFKNLVDMIWGKGSPAWEANAGFVWHPWAERMLEAACAHQYLGVIGCASSGKTDLFSVWGLINWLADPMNTMVLVTSTSLKDSRKRIWGSITKYWQYMPLAPGKLVDSIGMIRTDDGSGIFNDKRGIALIAGEKKKEREAVGKLIGMKNKKVILIADELPELSEALLEAAYSNLSTNPSFQMIGIGNFASMYDPLGQFVRPKSGWRSINPTVDHWETERGWCLRFDGLKSPNILEGEDKWPIYNSKMLSRHRRDLGENSIGFWRMVRSFPCPEGDDQVIYSEADLIAGEIDSPVVWASQPVMVAGCDPSFSTGGDRTILVIGALGTDTKSTKILRIDSIHHLKENLEMNDKSRSIQIAEQIIGKCKAAGVEPEHFGVDSTGPSIAFLHILQEAWSMRVNGIPFGGLPSEAAVSMSDARPSTEQYVNRVSELWYCGVQFLRNRQLRGISYDLAREMKARRYCLVKTTSMKIRVEPKTEMKERIGFSPDIADAFFCMLDVCRQKLRFIAGEASPFRVRFQLGYKDALEASRGVYLNSNYGEQNPRDLYGESYAA